MEEAKIKPKKLIHIGAHNEENVSFQAEIDPILEKSNVMYGEKQSFIFKGFTAIFGIFIDSKLKGYCTYEDLKKWHAQGNIKKKPLEVSLERP